MRLSDRAYEDLKQRLFGGDLAPGQFVSQRELVELTGIPLAPMREALKQLESEGLVRIVPQRGIQFVETNLTFIRSVFQLRIIFEKSAVTLFAEVAQPEELDALSDAHREMRSRLEDNQDPDLLREAQSLDFHFHRTLINRMQNPILEKLYAQNMDRITVVRASFGLLTAASMCKAMDEHLEIISALRERSASRAADKMEEHLSMGLRRALGV